MHEEEFQPEEPALEDKHEEEEQQEHVSNEEETPREKDDIMSNEAGA